MPVRKVVTIERQDNGPGVPALFCVRPGRRYGRWIWWSEQDVPEYARTGGRFEIERLPGQRRPGWRVIGTAPSGQ